MKINLENLVIYLIMKIKYWDIFNKNVILVLDLKYEVFRVVYSVFFVCFNKIDFIYIVF